MHYAIKNFKNTWSNIVFVCMKSTKLWTKMMHGNVELVTQGEIWVKKWWVVRVFAVFLLNNALFLREKDSQRK